MEYLNPLLARGKLLFKAAETRFNAITSPVIRAMVVAAIIIGLLMVLWALLPWIGLVILIVVIGAVVCAVSRISGNGKP